MILESEIIDSSIILFQFVIIGLILLQFLLIIIRFRFFWKDFKTDSVQEFPLVSVLISLRNEQDDLPGLLCALANLDYPKDKLQILFADDQSTDHTNTILLDACKEHSNYIITRISVSQTQLFSLNGKANALAILSAQATGSYYFFTDGDCRPDSQWIREGVSCFDGSIGMLMGITQVESASYFDRFQELDWWNTLGFVKVATDVGMPTTGLGNNMALSSEAYWKSGGFQSVKVSLTEDLALSRAIQKVGFEVAHQVNAGMLVRTRAEVTFLDLARQRKRWMSGVMSLPWYWLLLLSLQFWYFIAAASLFFFNPWIGILLATLKVVLQSIFLRMFARKAGAHLPWLPLLLFDFYYFVTSALTILYYFWPSPIIWKSRSYP
jgi:cellulose synthase/poly-beta-1,6-N-acetylglucosamine synthase-like glycosyltransferase